MGKFSNRTNALNTHLGVQKRSFVADISRKANSALQALEAARNAKYLNEALNLVVDNCIQEMDEKARSFAASPRSPRTDGSISSRQAGRAQGAPSDTLKQIFTDMQRRYRSAFVLSQ